MEHRTRIILFFLVWQLFFAWSCSAQNRPTWTELADQKSLAKVDTGFGEEQVQRMVADRPQMSDFVSKEDYLWKWSAMQYEGAATGKRVFWNSLDLRGKDSQYTSENAYPTVDRVGEIRMRARDREGKPNSGEKLWSCFVFECYNIANGPQFHRLHTEALAGKYSESEYIRCNTELEYEAALKTARFFRKYIVPMARERNLVIHKNLWKGNLPDTYEKWIGQYTDRNGYPWSYWGLFYQQKIVPYLKMRKIEIKHSL